MSGRSLGAGLITAALAVALAAQPVLGVSLHKVTGKVGEWSAFESAEKPSVTCVYSRDTNRLIKIRVKPPTLVKGAYKRLTWVGWRFQIVEPVEFEWGRPIFKSRVWKDEASRSVAADDFRPRTWYRPAGTSAPDGYHVYPIILWYEPGSKKTVEGRVVLGYEEYRIKKGSQHYHRFGTCPDFYGG
jgi:hypothetical protein